MESCRYTAWWKAEQRVWRASSESETESLLYTAEREASSPDTVQYRTMYSFLLQWNAKPPLRNGRKLTLQLGRKLSYS
jgi:hypothetical protein